MEASEGVGVGGRTKGERDLRIPVPNCGYIFKILFFLENMLFLWGSFLKIYMWSLSAFSYAQLPSVIDKNKWK